MSKINEIIALLLKSNKISTVSAKELLGISKTQMGKYVAGFYEPTLKNALLICDYFKCSLDFLLGIDLVKNRFGNFVEPNYITFNIRLKTLIEQENMSKYSLAKELGFNRNNMTYWDRNKTFPTLEILNKLAIKFKVAVEYLIGRTDIK